MRRWMYRPSGASFTTGTASGWCPRACHARMRIQYASAIDLGKVDVHPWFLDVVRSVLHRVDMLCLRQTSHCNNPGKALAKIMPSLQVPAPRLGELNVDIHVRDSVCLPTMFNGVTPALHHISLRSILWSPGNVFTGLTVLDLASGSRPQCQRLIDVLLANPLLEMLFLTAAIPSTIAADRRIDLPHLRLLDIRESPWSVVKHFLARLELPPNCQLVYVSGSMAPEGNDHVLTSILPPDLSYLRPFHRPTKLILSAPFTMSLCGSNATSTSTFEIFSSWVLDPQAFFEQSILSLITDHTADLALAGVRELWLGPLGGSHIPAKPVVSPPVETWVQLFDAMPRLETLAILPGFHFADILSALLPDDGAPLPVCPRLKMIRIVCGRCHALMQWSVIRNLVEARRGAGRPLQRILVQDYHAQMPKQDWDWGGVMDYETYATKRGFECPIEANKQFRIWCENLRELLMR